MRIFNKDDKINFVDENNVVVGYDSFQDCCEWWGFVINEKADPTLDELRDGYEEPDEDGYSPSYGNSDYDGYIFDKNYCKEGTIKGEEGNSYGCDSIATFRLVKGDAVLFLHLFNTHSGYYSHGFFFKNGTEILEEGCL